MANYLDYDGLKYYHGKVKTALDTKVDKDGAKKLSTEDYTTAEKNKLSGIAEGATKTAFTQTQKSGSEIGTITINGTATKMYAPNAVASSSGAGLMSAEDKKKLDSVDEGANKYTHPTYTNKASGLYKVTITAEGHVSAATAVVKGDITGLGIASNDAASTSANGLMSKEDKTKLDGFGEASTYALKSDITGMYKYKGSVASYNNLPTSGNKAGDVWDCKDTGMNYAWTSDGKWDELGGLFSVTSIANSEIDALFE